MQVRKFHRLNEDFNIIEVHDNIEISQKHLDYDTIKFTSDEKISNGEIIVVNDEPFVITNTIYNKNTPHEYSGYEFAYRATESIVYGFVAQNEAITTGVNYLLGNTFGSYYFPDLNNLRATIEGEIWNCDDLFKYLIEDKNYNVSFVYHITNDFIYTRVEIVKEGIGDIEVMLSKSDYDYSIELDSTQIATAIYPNLNEAGALDGWYDINVSPGVNMRYYDDEGAEIGDTIESAFNKDGGDCFMYLIDYDSNDFGDYGSNNFINTDEQNILKFKGIDVNETKPSNIYLRMQEEYIKLVESSIKVTLEINADINEMDIGTVVVCNLGEHYNLLSKGENVKIISTKIIEKNFKVIDGGIKTDIEYTTSDEGIKLKALIKGELQSLSNIISARS